MTAVAEAVADGRIGGRLWLYANYHCNLTCTYCLTESAPAVARREIPVERLPEIAAEAKDVGFTALGVTEHRRSQRRRWGAWASKIRRLTGPRT